jgi:hypothetical protein
MDNILFKDDTVQADNTGFADKPIIDESRRDFLVKSGMAAVSVGLALTRNPVRTIYDRLENTSTEIEINRFTLSVKPTFQEIARIRTSLGYPPTERLSPGAKYLKDNVVNNFISESEWYRTFNRRSGPELSLSDEYIERTDIKPIVQVGKAVVGTPYNALIKIISANTDITNYFNFDINNGHLFLPPNPLSKTNTKEIKADVTHEFGHGIDPDGINVLTSIPTVRTLKMLELKWNTLQYAKQIPGMFLNDPHNDLYFQGLNQTVGDLFIRKVKETDQINSLIDGDPEDMITFLDLYQRYIPEIFNESENNKSLRRLIGDEINDKIIKGKLHIIDKELQEEYADKYQNQLDWIYTEVFAEMVRTSILEPDKLAQTQEGKIILNNIQSIIQILRDEPNLKLQDIKRTIDTI